MTQHTSEVLFQAIEDTWPAQEYSKTGGFHIGRDPASQRTSSARLISSDYDIPLAENAFTSWGQTPIFMVTKSDGSLDHDLQERGYQIKDPVNLMSCPVSDLANDAPPPVSMFTPWPMLAIQREIWTDAGIGPERHKIMQRPTGHKTTILSRWDDKPTGTAFVATSGNLAILHALELRPEHRRKGIASWMVKTAARWAKPLGCDHLVVLVTTANIGAMSLYTSLGFETVEHYHYRKK